MATADTGTWLGALRGERRNFVVTLWIPSQTRDGDLLDHVYWRTQALEVMGRIFGGATVIEGEGAWRDDGRGGTIKREKNSTIVSFMAKSTWNKTTVTELAKFLHRMGRESKQGEIGLIVDGEYFAIQEFNR